MLIHFKGFYPPLVFSPQRLQGYTPSSLKSEAASEKCLELLRDSIGHRGSEHSFDQGEYLWTLKSSLSVTGGLSTEMVDISAILKAERHDQREVNKLLDDNEICAAAFRMPRTPATILKGAGMLDERFHIGIKNKSKIESIPKCILLVNRVQEERPPFNGRPCPRDGGLESELGNWASLLTIRQSSLASATNLVGYKQG